MLDALYSRRGAENAEENQNKYKLDELQPGLTVIDTDGVPARPFCHYYMSSRDKSTRYLCALCASAREHIFIIYTNVQR